MGGYINFQGSLLLQLVLSFSICVETTGPIFTILVPSDSLVSSASVFNVWRSYLDSKVTFDPLAATMYHYVVVSLLYALVLCILSCIHLFN